MHQAHWLYPAYGMSYQGEGQEEGVPMSWSWPRGGEGTPVLILAEGRDTPALVLAGDRGTLVLVLARESGRGRGETLS